MVGAGGHASVAYEILSENSSNRVSVFDDGPLLKHRHSLGWRIKGGLSELLSTAHMYDEVFVQSEIIECDSGYVRSC